MKLRKRAGLAAVAGLLTWAWVSAALAQDKGGAHDIQTSCSVAGIAPLEQLSVTWTGDCVDGMASGVGNVFAFDRGELRYILRGQFSAGRLTRQDRLRQCVSGACNDQVPVAVLREHAALARTAQAPVVAPAAPEPAQGASAATSAPVEIRAVDAIYRGKFVVDPKTGAVSGEGRVEFFDGRVFAGQLVNGKKEGRCTYLWADGEKYVGDWRNDLRDGSGEWTSSRGEHYLGQFRLGKREGTGVMTYANKMEYSGAWLADQPSGTGTFRYPNGDFYTGQWLHGERNGKGLAVWKDGLRYEGEWQRDRKNGTGFMRFPDGGTYQGSWRDDRAVGQGSVTFASGDTYVGDVRDGLPQGKGLYKWGSGDRFEGVFDAGKPTAEGVMTFHIETAATAPAGAASASVEPVAPAVPGVAAEVAVAAGAEAPVMSKATLCSRAYNAARGVSALRRFLEAFPEDECARHALARQKIAAIEESERKAAREQEDRSQQAKALVGLVVAYRQEYPFCVIGSGSNCQRVAYQFEVKGKIKGVDLARQGVQVQVVDVMLLGNEKGATPQLYAQGRLAAAEAFRSSMVGTTHWKTKADVGLAF